MAGLELKTFAQLVFVISISIQTFAVQAPVELYAEHPEGFGESSTNSTVKLRHGAWSAQVGTSREGEMEQNC